MPPEGYEPPPDPEWIVGWRGGTAIIDADKLRAWIDENQRELRERTGQWTLTPPGG